MSSDSSDITDTAPQYRKLLVIEPEGLLYRRFDRHKEDNILPFRRCNMHINGDEVYFRPYMKRFMRYCVRHFDVGLFTSIPGFDGSLLDDLLPYDIRTNLLFNKNRRDCTVIELGDDDPSIGNGCMFFKDLHPIWAATGYKARNSLLIDVSPVSGLINPHDTGIYPWPYNALDEIDFIDPLQPFCEKFLFWLRIANNVPDYVAERHWGQPSITRHHYQWKFYKKLLDIHMLMSDTRVVQMERASLR